MNLARWVAPMLAVVSLMAMTAPQVSAANIPMYDINTSRTRVISDPSLSPVQLYLSSPEYIHLGGQSLSTPTTVGNHLYEYTYGGPKGMLYDLNLPTIDTTAIIAKYRYALPPYLTSTASYAHSPMVFTPSQGAFAADSQDSLATAEGWQVIAVGRHIYGWPQGTWPNDPRHAPIYQRIYGVSTRYAVDLSPLITPPVPVKVFSMTTFRTVTVNLPLAVAGSWDGGVRAVPLGLPAGDVPVNSLSYLATGDPTASITSDPVYVASDPMFGGDPTAVFGVATWNQPRLEALDLKTGQAKSIGIGEVAAPVADAGSLVNGTLVYHDIYGNVYDFSLTGHLLGITASHSMQVEMAVDGSATYAMMSGATASVLQPVDGGTKVALVSVPGGDRLGGGAYLSYEGASSPSTVIGAMPRLPWCKPSDTYCRYISAWSYSGWTDVRGVHHGPGIVLMSAAAGAAYIKNGTFANGGQWIAAATAPYVGVVLDAGAGHYIISWSNSSPVGSALEIWAPVNYSLVASATPSVPSGGTVTVNAKPVPAGVTYSRLSPEQCSIGASPVTAKLTSTLGTSGYLSLIRTTAPTVSDPWSTWTTSWRLPPNDTGKPVTWAGVVSATDKFCSSASASISFTEEPGSTPPPATGTGLVLTPNPAMWSQWISATLQPSAPVLPSGETLVRWSIASATLDYPLKNANWATSLPYPPTPLGASEAMTANGPTASARFLENFWDGGCHTPVAGACVWIVNGLNQLSQQTTIPASTFQVEATYTLTITESRQVRSCTTKIDPTTGQPIIDPSTGKPEQVCTTKTVTSTFTTAPQTASASLIVDGTAKDVVGGG